MRVRLNHGLRYPYITSSGFISIVCACTYNFSVTSKVQQHNDIFTLQQTTHVRSSTLNRKLILFVKASIVNHHNSMIFILSSFNFLWRFSSQSYTHILLDIVNFKLLISFLNIEIMMCFYIYFGFNFWFGIEGLCTCKNHLMYS